MTKIFKLPTLFLALLFLIACGPDEADFKSDVPITRPSLEERIVLAEIKNEPEALPKVINLDVPFYVQAPDGDWSLPWKEACEESSITLAYYYLAEETLSKEAFKEDVLSLVDWQQENFGDYLHTTVDQTAQMLEGHFGFTDFRILEDPSIEDLKRELAMGNLIVAPFAGRMLKNPFYSGEGPYYHMLVIKGYDEENFITNDVGTKRGKDFIYSYEITMEALHDYHPSNIRNSAKKVLALE